MPDSIYAGSPGAEQTFFVLRRPSGMYCVLFCSLKFNYPEFIITKTDHLQYGFIF